MHHSFNFPSEIKEVVRVEIYYLGVSELACLGFLKQGGITLFPLV